MEYYGIQTNDKGHIFKCDLKLEADYEDKLFAQFKAVHIFQEISPEKLTTFITKDVVSTTIQESLLDVFELADAEVRNFMLSRLVGSDENDHKPLLAFSSKQTRKKPPTYMNLYDVTTTNDILNEKQMIRLDRKILD